MKDHWFWWLLMLAVLVWYSIVTVYVAVRGSLDIRDMLQRLARRSTEKSDEDNPQNESRPQ